MLIWLIKLFAHDSSPSVFHATCTTLKSAVRFDAMKYVFAVCCILFLLCGCVFYRPYSTQEPAEQTIEQRRKTPELSIPNSVVNSVVSRLTFPLDRMKIASRFGPRGKKFHEGVDLAGKRGNSVYAAHSGTVGISGERLSGYGEMIILKSVVGDFITVYGHLNEIHVRAGTEVKAGDLIGEVGSTGDATGPHLHFEIRLKPPGSKYYQSVDPEPFLRKIPVG